MNFGFRQTPVHYGMWRLFPFVPLLFPIGVFMALVGLNTWFSYLSYKEMVRHEEMHGTVHGAHETRETMTSQDV